MDMDALFAAVVAGDAAAAATTTVEMDADQKLDEEEETILHTESRKGNAKLVRVLTKDFASKNLLVQQDGFKQTALHSAAQHGHFEVVKELIDAATRYLPSSSDNDSVSPLQAFIRQASGLTGNTALHLAVIGGYVDIVKLLVEADPNDRHVWNYEGKTPIYIAAENENKEIIKVICTTCAAQSLEGPDGPGDRTTALHALIKYRGQEEDREVIMLMINTAKRWGHDDLSFEILFDKTDYSRKTVIELAVDRDNITAVELILLSDPAYKAGRKKHGLMRLIFKAIDEEGSADIVKALCQAYEDGINPEHKGVVDMILAIKRRHLERVYNLLYHAKHLVTFVEKDKGWTVLHYAVYHEFYSIFDLLIKAYADVGFDFPYENRMSTPFHLGVKYGYTDTMIRLMQAWPPSYAFAYTALNKNDQNILHVAASKNKKEMAQNILKYCPEKYKDNILKHQDINGDTPLHLFISHGCFVPEMIRYKGLDITVANTKGFTPPDMLYARSEIVCDQVMIKTELDNIMTSRSSKFWREEKEKTDIWGASVVLPSRRERKNVLFKELTAMLMQERAENLRRDLEDHRRSSRERANTQVVVTALIITVAFTVGFTMPGGLHQSEEVDEGLVIFSRKTAFKAFIVSDALALLTATSSLIFYYLEIINQDAHQVVKLSAASTGFSIVSLMAMFLTYIAGTYVVLSQSPALAITVCVISSLFFLLLLIVIVMKIVYDRPHIKRNQD